MRDFIATFKKKINMHHIDQLNNFFNIKNVSLYIHTSKEEEAKVNLDLDQSFSYIVIFPGGNWKPKIWPVKNYNQLFQKLFKAIHGKSQ